MSRFLVFGRKSRDTIILGSFESLDDATTLAESAVKEGRSAEVFVVLANAYFSESTVRFGPVDPVSTSTADFAKAQGLTPAPSSRTNTPDVYPGPGHDASPKGDNLDAPEPGSRTAEAVEGAVALNPSAPESGNAGAPDAGATSDEAPGEGESGDDTSTDTDGDGAISAEELVAAGNKKKAGK